MSEVVIIGAGPSGALAGSMLNQLGHKVVILEKAYFPRFSIGESLLPQCMEFIEAAGMFDDVKAAGFQKKNGAAFACGDRQGSFDFRDKFSAGAGTTFQVQRGAFDKILADAAAAQGVDIRYGCEIITVDRLEEGCSRLTYKDEAGDICSMSTSFLLDASGFGRVLPRIFDLDVPSNLPSRRSIFTHIQDNISDVTYDREKILIVIHPEHPDVWYWLIPFNDGRSSVGVVAESDYFDSLGADALDALLLHAISASPNLSALLKNAKFDTGVQSVQGYSCNVHSLYGEGYALLGNAGEFLDPVFSSGVTIAMKSASLAAPLVSKQLQGEHVDWQQEYADKLMVGVDTFRAYVEGWYGGTFQDVVFAEHQNPEIRRMVSSILAGYAWDQSNPFVQNPERRLKAIAELCAP